MDGNQYNLLQLFADGGIWMYPLVLCSLLALGVIIAKAYTLWLAHRSSRKILAEVAELGQAGRIEEAIELAANTPGPVAAILLSGLRRVHEQRVSGKDIERAIKTTGTIELGFLERGLIVLATVSNVAPLMGFLGTVAGMILAFGAIEQAGNVDPGLVAGGIKVALLTTATGLFIAIPVNIGYNFFVTRIDTLIVDMEQGTQEILNLAWDMEREGDLVISGRDAGVVGSARSASPRALQDAQQAHDTDRPTAPPPQKPRSHGGAEGTTKDPVD